MSVKTSIMSMFGGQQQPTMQVAAQANPTVPSATTPLSDGSVKAIPGVPGVESNKSPLEGFNELWNTDPNAPKPASLVPEFSLDPKKLMDAANSVDFAKQISSAAMEAAKAGDFSAMINETLRLAFTQTATVSTNIMKDALTKQADVFHTSVLPEALRRHDASTALRADNPVFESPAVKPMLEMVERQFAAKNPTMSAVDLTKNAKEFLLAFGGEMITGSGKTIVDSSANKTSQQPGGMPARKEEDWSSFFGVDTAA